MPFSVFRDFDATKFEAVFDELAEALAALQRNHSLVLPEGWTPNAPIEITTDAVMLHTGAPDTQVTLGSEVTVFYLAGSGSAIVRTDDSGAVIHGNDAGLTLFGAAGRDMANGGAASDMLFGGDGEDVLTGNAGDDLLVAGSGNDRLVGGDGDDLMIGGWGRNSFYGGAGADQMVIADGPGGFDVLFDFDPAEDRLILAGPDAPDSFVELLLTGEIRQAGAHTVIRYGDQTVQFLNTDVATITEEVVLFDAPSAIPGFPSSAVFLESGLDTMLDTAEIGGTTYRLRDGEPPHADYKFQDSAGRWWSPDYFVVAAAGQSNMVGAGWGADMTLDPNVIAWDWSEGELIAADYGATPAGGPAVQTGTVLRNNLYYPFANEVSEALGRPVLVIAHPVSGSRIDSWLASGTGTHWETLEGDIAAALSAVGQSAVDAFLWHQGESDFVLDPAVYQGLMTEFLGQVRSAGWASGEMAMLVGELSRPGLNHIQNVALQALELANTDPLLAFVSSTGLTTFDSTQIHFDGESLNAFGGRFFDALAGMLGLGEASGPAVPNTAPTIAGLGGFASGIEIAEGAVVTLNLSDLFADAEGDALWVYGHLDDRGTRITTSEGSSLTLRPGYEDAGTYTLSVFASDYHLDSPRIDIPLTITDRDPALEVHANRSYELGLSLHQDIDTAMPDLRPNRGLDILLQEALSPDAPTLIEVESLGVRGDATISGSFQLAPDVLRLFLAGEAAFDVTGNALDNYLVGNAGANTMTGGVGRDRLFGEAGDDHLTGGTENDQLFGGDGNDYLDAGPGADHAWGGAGADTFAFATGDGSLQARDFDRTEDRIRLDLDGIADFDTLLAEGRVFQSADRVVIDIGTDRLMVHGLTVEDMSADIFDFV